MIDLTPLDVRKKAGDFRRMLRGYDPQEVEGFLQLAAERLEELVKENLTLRERSERLQEQVTAHQDRERAVQEALVMAQQLRADLKGQAEREANLRRQETEAELRRLEADAVGRVEACHRALEELERRRLRFLKSFRALLQREMEAVEVEEARMPLEDTPMDLELGAKDRRSAATAARPEGPPRAEPGAVAPLAEGDGTHDPRLWLSSILQEGTGQEDEGEEPRS